MADLSEYMWEGLYVLKQLYDYGFGENLLHEYSSIELDGDYIGDIAMRAVFEVFEDTRDYYNNEIEVETYVFFDRTINEFFETCRTYEKHNQLLPEENKHRKAMEKEANYALSFNSYSYDYCIYSGDDPHEPCRVVLCLHCEFCAIHEIPGGLVELRSALITHTEEMKRDMSAVGRTNILPFPKRTESEKEAA